MNVFISRERREVTLTIDAGATTSDSKEVPQFPIAGVLQPAITGATWKFQVSNDDDNWSDVPDLGSNATGGKQTDFTASSNNHFVVWAEISHFRYFRIVSASSEAAERSFVCNFLG